MSQDIDPSHPEASHPDSPPTGALPEDFFAGPGRIEPDPDAGVEAMPPGVGPLPPRRPAFLPAARAVGARWPILAIVGAVLLGNLVLFLGGVLAGWALARKGESTPARNTPPDVKAMTNEVARVVESQVAGSEVEGLRAEVMALTRRMGQLQGRLEARPEPGPTPDLGTLKARVEELARATGPLSALPEELRLFQERMGAIERRIGTLDERVRALGERAGTLEVALGSLRKEVASPPGRGDKADSPTDNAGSDSPAKARPDVDAVGRAGAEGAALFKEGRYAQARAVFLKQAEATPDDARLWYYAALANGCATREWRGETERLVKQGIARERAGTPERAQIDALFADLGNTQVAEWLRSWRKRALRP